MLRPSSCSLPATTTWLNPLSDVSRTHTYRKMRKWNESHFIPYCKQVTKIGRDAVLYVESLIESIMGGLEGLINILDSEGGFGALENQVDTFKSYCNIKKYLNLILCSCSIILILEKSLSFFRSRQPLISIMHQKFQFLQLNLQSYQLAFLCLAMRVILKIIVL